VIRDTPHLALPAYSIARRQISIPADLFADLHVLRKIPRSHQKYLPPAQLEGIVGFPAAFLMKPICRRFAAVSRKNRKECC